MFDYVSGPVTKLMRMIAAEAIVDMDGKDHEKPEWFSSGADALGMPEARELMLSIVNSGDLRKACLASAVDDEKASDLLAAFMMRAMTIREEIEEGRDPR